MTEEKLRRMMKYVELIRKAMWISGIAYGQERYGSCYRQITLTDYLVHRMEREMKR